MFGRKYRRLEHEFIVLKHRAGWHEDIIRGVPPLPPGEYTGTRDCDALNLAIARAYSDAKHLWDEVGGGFIRMMVERKSDGSPSVALRGESEGGG